MADSYTGRLRFRLQATGFNLNTWGSLLNTAAIQLIDDAISGLSQVTFTTGDVTLSTANGAADQARMAILQLIGAPTGALNMIVPALSKLYLVVNNTGQTITVKTSGGSGVAITTGTNQHLYCDGTNVAAVQASASGTVANSAALGGFPAANYPQLGTVNEFTAGQAVAFSTLTDAATVTMNALLSNNFIVTLAGNRVLVINNPGDGQTIELWVKQDVVGARTLTFPGNVQFEAGSSNALTATASAIDRFKLTYNLAQNLFIARRGAQSAAAGVVGIVLSSNEMNVSLFERAGSPGSLVTVNVTVAVGVILRSADSATGALEVGAFPAGSIINLTNLGYILGKGGDGGFGASTGASGTAVADDLSAFPGFAGGPALRGSSTATLNVFNAAGFIWGGGGGGGGGASASTPAGNCSNGGGGGGGKGGGKGAPGGTSSAGGLHNGGVGGVGGSNPSSSAGSGGSGSGSVAGSNGGAGGDWGSGGSAGSNGTSGTTGTGGASGTAGKAIDLNGGTVNVLSGGGGPNIKGLIS